MGPRQSTSIKSVTDILMQNSTNYVNNNTTQSLASESNTNSFTLATGPDSEVDCNVIVGQSITAEQDTKVMAKVQNATELQNKLNGIIDNTLQQQQSSVNGFLATAFGSQSSSTDIQNTMHTIINTNVTENDVTSCNAVLDNLNTGQLLINHKLICSPGGSIGAMQSIVSDQVAQCFSDKITTALMTNTNIANAVNNANNSQSTKNTGVPTSLADLIGLGGLNPTTLMYFGIFIIILMIAYKFLGPSPSFSSPHMGSQPMDYPHMGSQPMGSYFSQSMGPFSSPMGPSQSMGSQPMGSQPMGSQPMGSQPMGSPPMGPQPMGSSSFPQQQFQPTYQSQGAIEIPLRM